MEAYEGPAPVTIRDSRLDRVAEGLTAKERGLLVLRSWKENRDEDPAWRSRMPPEQTREFNQYIGLMNAVNERLGPYIVFLRAEVEKLGLRHGWLLTFQLWQREAHELWEFIAFATTEPVTQAEYDELEAKAREEYQSVQLLAYVLCEHHDGFTNDDLLPDEDAHEKMVRPEAWECVKAEKVKELQRLVKDGVLPGKGRGEGLTVQAGPFYDRLELPVPFYPPFARAYDVVPDDQAEEAKMRRWQREEARKAYEFGPRQLIPYLPELADFPELQVKEPSKIDDTVTILKGRLREGIQDKWRMLQSVELVVAEVAEAFDGEDPAIPEVRHTLDHCRTDLEELRGATEKLTGPFELPEPGDDEVAWVRDVVERAVARSLAG